MYGSGLLKGLRATMKHWLDKAVTEEYPEQRPDLPPASQGFFDYKLDKCIACGLCVRACPNKVITLESEKNEEGKKVVTKYQMDVMYCLYCGLCIEACPTAALVNANNFEIACYYREDAEYDFTTGEPQKMNEAFNKVQEDYWRKKRPGGNPVKMPMAYKSVRTDLDSYVGNKPAAKPKAKPAAPAGDAAAAPAKAAAPAAETPKAEAATAEKPVAEAPKVETPVETTNEKEATKE